MDRSQSKVDFKMENRAPTRWHSGTSLRVCGVLRNQGIPFPPTTAASVLLWWQKLCPLYGCKLIAFFFFLSNITLIPCLNCFVFFKLYSCSNIGLMPLCGEHNTVGIVYGKAKYPTEWNIWLRSYSPQW